MNCSPSGFSWLRLPLLALLLLFTACAEPQPADTMEDDTMDADEMAEMDDMAAMEPTTTVVDVALGDSTFSTLVTALQAADLVETLQGPGPFTVFAPTNAAFDKLPEGTLDELTMEENQEQLTGILLYHVASGRVMAADVAGMSEIETAQGAMLPIQVMDDGTVMVGDATVVTTDIQADNGIIHVIDTVLMPPDDM